MVCLQQHAEGTQVRLTRKNELCDTARVSIVVLERLDSFELSDHTSQQKQSRIDPRSEHTRGRPRLSAEVPALPPGAAREGRLPLLAQVIWQQNARTGLRFGHSWKAAQLGRQIFSIREQDNTSRAD